MLKRNILISHVEITNLLNDDQFYSKLGLNIFRYFFPHSCRIMDLDILTITHDPCLSHLYNRTRALMLYRKSTGFIFLRKIIELVKWNENKCTIYFKTTNINGYRKKKLIVMVNITSIVNFYCE
jgi:hypothetical protein